MTIIQVYKGKFNSNSTCVCVVDDTSYYDTWTREIVKNRADYTITNVTGMNYDVLVGKDNDNLLKKAAGMGYKYAIVISAGTEFVNGSKFFDNHPREFEGIVGHILDGGDAYYGLHYQCFSINLRTYKKLGCPNIGQDQPFDSHKQMSPFRSKDNIHDNYLPTWINQGITDKNYKHKIHGWNIISTFLNADIEISAYEEDVRQNKIYLYREGNCNHYVYQKYNYCLTTHVHTTATGLAHQYPRPYKTPIKLLITPANTDAANKRLNGHTADIIYYDYNPTAVGKTNGVQIDPIHDPEKFVNMIPIQNQRDTVIDFSNIFAYEGTVAFLPLKYRIQQENMLINLLQNRVPDATAIFDKRAAEGIRPWIPESGKVKDLTLTNWNDLELPAWHH